MVPSDSAPCEALISYDDALLNYRAAMDDAAILVIHPVGYPHATLVLIDGEKLARLMIKYNLGVTVERAIEIKRVESDYFDDVS